MRYVSIDDDITTDFALWDMVIVEPMSKLTYSLLDIDLIYRNIHNCSCKWYM